MIAKGTDLTLRSSGGKGILCTVVDSNSRSVWVRLPTLSVLKLVVNPHTQLLEGRVGSMEFTVDLTEK